MAVVFGPTPDVFFVSYGRRYAAQGVPLSFTDKVKTGELAPMATSWISMDPSCQFWVACNFVSENIHSSNNLPANVHAHLIGTPTAPKSDYISFPAERNGYFAKHMVGYGWSTDLHTMYENAILATRERVGPRTFDTTLRFILFGTRGTYLIVFESGFLAELQGRCAKIRTALAEFSEPGWSLEHGSALSVHNEDYYFLKFSKRGVPGVQIRANMPDFMYDKFKELMRIAENPIEDREIALERQMIQDIIAQRSTQPSYR
ncbi:hypothetical protein JB92DRAFT_3133173 [Gautieria morchelliformis]|nr:hypothetical protein JB92DRAFT_3133173 [Gautieria morchelliformis]